MISTVELPVTLGQLRDAFAAALADAPRGSTFTLRGGTQEIREDAVRVAVVMQFAGNGWATIDVDLACATEADITQAIRIAAVELPGVEAHARIMRNEFLIAQKIHAILTPDEPNYEYAYARHVVDVVFLARHSTIADIRHACAAVFAARSARSGRAWPPQSVTLPERWLREYAATIALYPDLQIVAADVPVIFANLLAEVIGKSTPLTQIE